MVMRYTVLKWSLFPWTNRGWYTSNQCLRDSDGDIVDYTQEDHMPHLPSWSRWLIGVKNTPCLCPLNILCRFCLVSLHHF
ncbi:poly(U)-specific endoribonuclease-like [Platysternon megacephalum]|uniref:Poly(U)-specific endoribonuclease-like n=1 Tax=Platysternon megacephalum TaxID=55544 RepID=A0A4D9E7N4_9SAUR|nr:poly(U)-specific endoribonuclease-like [Platysternon megacephalum]